MGKRWLIFFSLSVLLSVGFSADLHQDDYLSVKYDEVGKAFQKTGIVPDVIDDPPWKILEVKWKTVEAHFGNELKPKDVADEPQLQWENSLEKFYCLLMVDPDEPDRKNHTEGEFLHWMVVNIPAEDVKKGEVLADYVGPVPPKHSGLHRYVLLKYEQPERKVFDEPRLKFPSPTGFKDRVKFSSRNFAKKYNMGNTHTANFFFAEWDDSVKALMEKLQ